MTKRSRKMLHQIVNIFGWKLMKCESVLKKKKKKLLQVKSLWIANQWIVSSLQLSLHQTSAITVTSPHLLFSFFCSDVPKEQRLQAVRAAILLMPDENREVLQTLLYFLRDVTSLVEENQMTPMNLAVCLGPSLFHLSILKNETLSPRWTHEHT